MITTLRMPEVERTAGFPASAATPIRAAANY
jgi:hypothetical protein